MIYGLIFSHWLADFVYQTDWMAKNKSKDNFALFCHVGCYSCVLMMYGITTNLYKRYYLGEPTTIHVFSFVAINGLSHWFIDYFTSRYNSKMWEQGRVHDFFVGVGFDQALHMAILILTFNLFIAVR